jgi:uridylate kinase
MKVVVRIGGSVVASPPNPALIMKYIALLKTLKEQGHAVVAVVGGGALARDFIKIAGEMGLDEISRDWAAIHVSRLFAQLFVLGLRDHGCGTVSVSLAAAAACLKQGKIVVMGGLKPGMTTDAVAALIGAKVSADLLVKASDVAGIFTEDPKKHPRATKIAELGFEDLEKIFEEDTHKAGIHQILDPKAVHILRRSGLKMVVVDGFTPKNVLRAIAGRKVGTTIT